MTHQVGRKPGSHLGTVAKTVLICFAVSLCLLWPAIVNSQYILFFDTLGYLRGALQAVRALFGVETEWSTSMLQSASVAASDPTVPDNASDGYISFARSIYYGGLLLAGQMLGGLWSSAIIQMSLLVWTLFLTLHLFFRDVSRVFPLVLVGLGLFTPLSFYISYLMPDVFTGVTILAVAALAVCDDIMTRWERLSWAVLLVISLMFHSSHVAIAIPLAVLALLIMLVSRRAMSWRAPVILAMAVCIAVLSQVVFYKTVEAVYGHAPLRPPFLMSRVITDGPGLEYLRETCPQNGFRVCDFLPVLPLGNDQFLWSKIPEAGVYGVAGPQVRKELVDEQFSFVMQVLKYDLPGQLRASVAGFFEQLSRFSIDEFRYTEKLKTMLAENLPAAERRNLEGTLLYQDAFPFRPVNLLFSVALVLSVAGLVWWGWRGADAPLPAREDHRRRMWLFFAIIILGILGNAAVTGILSTPHDRYQARVIWLFPLMAALAMLDSYKHPVRDIE